MAGGEILTDSSSYSVITISRGVHHILWGMVEELRQRIPPAVVSVQSIPKPGAQTRCPSQVLQVFMRENEDTASYRPITLVPVVSKIVEVVVKNQIDFYFETNQLLTPTEFCFRCGMSVVGAVGGHVYSILEGYEKDELSQALL
ncbi:hypothetical protein J6590_025498 [Homalodisca vitripennis]|nr:hypothetical protein J6590_025498 [Homalodisca vitripennis]